MQAPDSLTPFLQPQPGGFLRPGRSQELRPRPGKPLEARGQVDGSHVERLPHPEGHSTEGSGPASGSEGFSKCDTESGKRLQP